jgi:copper chaperone CopZ
LPLTCEVCVSRVTDRLNNFSGQPPEVSCSSQRPTTICKLGQYRAG